MSTSRWKMLPTGLVVGAILVISGCLKSTDTSGPGASSNGSPPDMGKGPGGAIRLIMFKIGKGPQQLDASIGRELQSDSPPWETLQKQAGEYKQLTGDLTKHDPPRGSKESWQEKTTAFAEAATSGPGCAGQRPGSGQVSPGLPQQCVHAVPQ
jgi:hypothetical protein